MKEDDYVLKKGDKVVMHTCLEAETHNGRIWTCEGDEFKANSSGNGVFLEGFSGWFYTEYLQKVNIAGIELKNIDLTGITLEEQCKKIEEEEEEFKLSLNKCKWNDEEKCYYLDVDNVIEEFYDTLQAKLGLLNMYGISAKEVMQHYPLHEEKMLFRPRNRQNDIKR